MLVIGANGQLARSLAAEDAVTPDVAVMACGRPEIDLTHPGSIAAAIVHLGADIVVNAAAYTAVDAAEQDQAAAFAINAAGAANTAIAAADASIPIVHVSTDYVFNGDNASLYSEDDAPDPRTVYGRSKLAGETAVAAANSNHAILRTAWVYSPWSANFVRTMLRLAGERDTIHVVDDQWGNPTYAPDLAAAIVIIGCRLLAAPDDWSLRGVFHLTGTESASWCGLAREIMAASDSLGGPVAKIVPITTAEYPTAAARPRDSRLDTTAALRAFGVLLPPRGSSLASCIDRILSERRNPVAPITGTPPSRYTESSAA